MNKGDLTNDNDNNDNDNDNNNKAHARKGKSLVEFSSKKYFQILQKIQNLLFTVKISFLPSTI